MLRRLLPLLAFVALAVLLYAGIRLSATRDGEALPSPFIGKPAPAFSLPALHDPQRVVDSAALRGQPYLLNVWASWCFACREEHPFFMQLASESRIRLVGYNYKDAREDALRWLQQFGDPYDLIVADEIGRVAIDYGVYGAPETFLIDADGVIRFKHIGPLTPEVWAREIAPRLEASTP